MGTKAMDSAYLLEVLKETLFDECGQQLAAWEEIDDEGFDTFEALFFYAYHSVSGEDCFIENDAED